MNLAEAHRFTSNEHRDHKCKAFFRFWLSCVGGASTDAPKTGCQSGFFGLRHAADHRDLIAPAVILVTG